MPQYAVGVMEEQRQIVNVGTTRSPQYRVADVTPAVTVPVAPATPVSRSADTQPTPPVPSLVAEQRLGAMSIGVDGEQVKELVDLIIAAQVPPLVVKPYIRQTARGLPNPDDFIAAAHAELGRRGGPTA
jgi:hypothetical protein